MSNLVDEIQTLATEKKLPALHLERWLEMDELSAAGFLDAARTLRLRTGQMVAALDLFSEIAVRESEPISAILSRPALRRILTGRGSAPERAHSFLNELRSIRFPRLHDTIDRLRREIAGLELPRGISILLPRELASDELTVQLNATQARDLERLIDVLTSKRERLARIFEILSGNDEV